ncbi:unnamed protein product, partial [Prunus brigantina]
RCSRVRLRHRQTVAFFPIHRWLKNSRPCHKVFRINQRDYRLACQRLNWSPSFLSVLCRSPTIPNIQWVLLQLTTTFMS